MGDTLGSGQHAAAVYDRTGRSRLLPIETEGLTDLSWGRTRNAYSEASITIAGAEVSQRCWGDLGQVHTWAHSLVLFRDDERVWEGPIVDMPMSPSKVTLTARDVSSWLTRRRVRLKRVIGKDDAAQSVLDEASTTIRRALSPDDPNVLSWVRTIPDRATPTTTRDLKVNSGYYYDDLATLVEAGLNWTVVGRSIILWTDNNTLGRTETLVPERDTVADLTVTEAGSDLVTVATAAHEKVAQSVIAGGVPGSGVSAFYGLHDMLVDPGERKKAAQLARVAARAVRAGYPAPTRVDFPQDARLDCDAPFPVSALVPGVLIPVESSATPRPVSGAFTLDSMAVKVSADGTEEVTVTLVPAGS